jgi:hypothetical protein
MALPESAFQTPYWIRYKEGATLSRDDRLRSANMSLQYNNQPNRHWRIEPQPGFNAQSPSITVDRVNLSTDTPYIRAR